LGRAATRAGKQPQSAGHVLTPASPQGEDGQGLPLPRRYAAVAALCAATAAVVLDGAIAVIALPLIARDLGVAPAQTVHIVTIYQLVSVISLIPMAALGDRFGHRRIFRFGLILLTLSILPCLMVRSLGLLLGLRFVQAIGASLTLSISSALLRDVYPLRLLGRGLALNSLIVSLFTWFAPTLGGVILAHARWPLVFASAVPFALAALLLSPRLPDPVRHSARFDRRAAALYGGAMALFFCAIDGNIGLSAPVRIMAVALAVALAVQLVRHERHAIRPVIPLDLLRQPLLALSAAGSLLCFTASMAVMLILPFRMQVLYGWSIGQIGLAMSVWPLTTLLVAPAVGIASDRVPAKLIGTAGMALAALALLLTAIVEQPDAIDLYWRPALCGAGFACFTASNARLILAASPADRAASVGSLISTARLTGQAMGSILAGVILAAGWAVDARAFLLPGLLVLATGLCSLSRSPEANQSADQ